MIEIPLIALACFLAGVAVGVVYSEFALRAEQKFVRDMQQACREMYATNGIVAEAPVAEKGRKAKPAKPIILGPEHALEVDRKRKERDRRDYESFGSPG